MDVAWEQKKEKPEEKPQKVDVHDYLIDKDAALREVRRETDEIKKKLQEDTRDLHL